MFFVLFRLNALSHFNCFFYYADSLIVNFDGFFYFSLSADSLEDMIIGAIISSNEPKTASVGLIKKYLTNYHEEFNVANRPQYLRKALEKAESQGLIR